ncbi:hypothetical protein AVEN_175842-1 [Araneus ventricosus]|uniref:Uncharacterized protein n=1 Tax=Araneus ventricosus TaxID=182803 RepID=A0A4Y2BB77_ARAVE|nr:hypothetical protein AVEN_175842-1 [Araneus ventricosus]
MKDKRYSIQRQAPNQTRKGKDSKNTHGKKLFPSLKRQLHIATVFFFGGLLDRKEGAYTPPPYTQGHIEGESFPSKPLFLDGEKFCSDIPPFTKHEPSSEMWQNFRRSNITSEILLRPSKMQEPRLLTRTVLK